MVRWRVADRLAGIGLALRGGDTPLIRRVEFSAQNLPVVTFDTNRGHSLAMFEKSKDQLAALLRVPAVEIRNEFGLVVVEGVSDMIASAPSPEW